MALDGVENNLALSFYYASNLKCPRRSFCFAGGGIILGTEEALGGVVWGLTTVMGVGPQGHLTP